MGLLHKKTPEEKKAEDELNAAKLAAKQALALQKIQLQQLREESKFAGKIEYRKTLNEAMPSAMEARAKLDAANLASGKPSSAGYSGKAGKVLNAIRSNYQLPHGSEGWFGGARPTSPNTLPATIPKSTPAQPQKVRSVTKHPDGSTTYSETIYDDESR